MSVTCPNYLVQPLLHPKEGRRWRSLGCGHRGGLVDNVKGERRREVRLESRITPKEVITKDLFSCKRDRKVREQERGVGFGAGEVSLDLSGRHLKYWLHLWQRRRGTREVQLCVEAVAGAQKEEDRNSIRGIADGGRGYWVWDEEKGR
jgi:hypothetical protein